MDSNAPLSQADCLITPTAIARLSLLLLLLLQEKIYRIQMANYNKGLGKLANISAEEAYANGFTKHKAVVCSHYSSVYLFSSSIRRIENCG